MASYLVVEEGEVPIIHQAEAKTIQQVIEKLAPTIGDKVTVYRVASKKTVVIREETTRVLEIT